MRKLIMMGGVAPAASATPAAGEQKKHSKNPAMKGSIFCRVGNKLVSAGGKTRQS